MSRVLRRAGSPWRLLVHSMPRGKSYDVTNDPYVVERIESNRKWLGDAAARSAATLLEGTEFDELVVGKWIHIEQQSASRWWMNIAGVTVLVRADRDGRPKHVTVFGPNDYDQPVNGCIYELGWTETP